MDADSAVPLRKLNNGTASTNNGGCPTPTQATGAANTQSSPNTQHINSMVVQGVCYPTARAAKIAAEALEAAKEYYKLFFTTEIEDTSQLAPDKYAEDTHQQQQQQQQQSLASANEGKGCGGENNYGESSTSDYLQYDLAAQTSLSGEMSEDLTATPLKVRNTPYHTFFPPVLSRKRREVIVRNILNGRSSRPFEQWHWRKAEDYHALHARNVQHNNVYQDATSVCFRVDSSSAGVVLKKVDVESGVAGGGGDTGTKVTAVASLTTDGRVGRVPHSSTSAEVRPFSSINNNSKSTTHRVDTKAAGAAAAATTTTTTTSTTCNNTEDMAEYYRTILAASTNSQGGPAAAVAATTYGSGIVASRAGIDTNNTSPTIPSPATLSTGESPVNQGPSAGEEGDDDATDTTATSALAFATAVANAAAGTTDSSTSSFAAQRSCPPFSPLAVGTTDFISDQSMYTIPTSQQGPEYFRQAAEDGTKTLIIIMVGLPARGKTFLAQKICRLLGWHGSRAKVQNIQVAWRRVLLDWEKSQRAVDDMRESYQRSSFGGKSPSVISNGCCCGGGGGGGDSNHPASPCGDVADDDAVRLPRFNGSHTTSTTTTTTVMGKLDTKMPLCPSMEPFSVNFSSTDDVKNEAGSTAPTTTTAATDTSPFSPQRAEQQNSSSHMGESGCAASNSSDCLRADHFRSLVQDPNSAARRLYRHVLRGFAKDCSLFFSHGGEVVVINDDFVSDELRQEAEAIFAPLASQLFYMEVIRDEEENKQFNDCKVRDPMEYPREKINRRDAKKDFVERVKFLEEVYEPLEIASASRRECGGENDSGSEEERVTHGGGGEDRYPRQQQRTWCGGRRDLSYIKVQNSSTIEIHGISGYVASRIISYVMNLSQVKVQHPIYFVRHGQSCYNLEDRIGGNPLLTAQGMRDAAALLEFLDSLKQHLQKVDERQRRLALLTQQNQSMMINPLGVGSMAASPHSKPFNSSADNLEIWTSQLRRAIQTAELSERLLNVKTLRWSSLNEIHAGVCEDMTYAEVGEKYPLIELFRNQSKYTFRYPEGESYQDLVVRLEPVIMELENANKVVVVVAHQAVLRCLLAYFGSTSAESSIQVEVPHRTVWRCTYDSKGIASLDELTLDNTTAGFSFENEQNKKKAETSTAVAAAAAGTGTS